MTLKGPARVRGASAVGLDIGSNAVRAAEVSRSRRGLALQRFAQVGLPRGAVVDGEVVEAGTVVTALRRLWSEGGFATRNVVLGISGQRVIVRQAEVPAMSESDFRSALRFQAMDLIPIPVDDALLDFVTLSAGPGEPKHRDQMQILLAAAHRTLVDGHLAVLREAGLRAVAVDPAPMAAARAAAAEGLDPEATVAVIDVGADLTVIALRQGGRVRFSRILNSGGADLTMRLADRLAVEFGEAETLKRSGAPTPSSLLTDDLDPLVAEIESSLSFFASQLGGTTVERTLVTGGASRDAEFIAELSRRLPGPVDLLDPLAGLDVEALSLDLEQRLAASSCALLPIGAARWLFEVPAKRLSLLPTELAAAAATRRKLVAAAAGVVVLAAGLAGLSYQRSQQVDRARAQATAIQTANASTSLRIADLQDVSRLEAAIKSRLAVLSSAVSGDVAWSPLLAEITAAMPAGTHLTALTFADAAGLPATGTATTSKATVPTASGTTVAGPLGSVTMSVRGPASEEQVAIWLRALRHVRGLEGVWVPSAAVGGGTVTFTSSGGLTIGTPMVDRAAQDGSGT